MAQKKWYAVWSGAETGVFDTWAECRSYVEGYKGARYKSFATREEAEEALAVSPDQYISTRKRGARVRPFSREGVEEQSIAVDGATSRNPGPAEYRGVWVGSGEVIFSSPIFEGTNNIAEFLAIVHAMALCVKVGKPVPIYSDSRTAIKWIGEGRAKSKLPRTPKYMKAHELVARAEAWLAAHPAEERPPLLKWNTTLWGEIPADFGRK